jgi:hypothetical protein
MVSSRRRRRRSFARWASAATSSSGCTAPDRAWHRARHRRYVLAGESLDQPIIGRLVERGLNDELKRHRLCCGRRRRRPRSPHQVAPSRCRRRRRAGSPSSSCACSKTGAERRLALAVRSDFDLPAQVTAVGATWLDRQAVASCGRLRCRRRASAPRSARRSTSEPSIWSGKVSPNARPARRLCPQSDRDPAPPRVWTRPSLQKLASDTGLTFNAPPAANLSPEPTASVSRSPPAAFAMLDDGLGFQLVPWSPSLEKQLGRHVSGVARGDGGVDWSFSRKRGLGL